jgi:hypothetical protein
MDTADFANRLEAARNRRCPFSFVHDYCGLDLARDDNLRRDYEFWMHQRKIPDALAGETVDRWWLETFLQARQLIPLKWMALQLGMKQDSLVRLRERMQETGPLLAYHPSPNLLGKIFEEDLLAQLPKYRFRTFTNHDDFCRHLHQWLTEVFGVSVDPEYCATSQRVGRQPPDFAKYIDILALEPVGPRYQAWLDFGKWMTLPPDRCSLLTYAAHRDVLAPFLAGQEAPVVPPEMEALLGGAAR